MKVTVYLKINLIEETLFLPQWICHPSLISYWVNPPNCSLRICLLDPKVGGAEQGVQLSSSPSSPLLLVSRVPFFGSLAHHIGFRFFNCCLAMSGVTHFSFSFARSPLWHWDLLCAWGPGMDYLSHFPRIPARSTGGVGVFEDCWSLGHWWRAIDNFLVPPGGIGWWLNNHLREDALRSPMTNFLAFGTVWWPRHVGNF